MLNIVLDTNIFDLLERDNDTLNCLQRLVGDGRCSVLVPRKVAEELRQRPSGIPNLFPVTFVGHTVARAGTMCAGDSLGSGVMYDAHLGDSQKTEDALIADAASWHADWFVSADKRCIKRFEDSTAQTRCMPMRYEVFVEKLAVVAREDDEKQQ